MADKTMTGVGLRVRQHEAGSGVWAKTPKPSCDGSVLGVPCKWRYGAMQRGGGHGLIRHGRGGGCAFANARQGVGFGPKTRNRAVVARFWACRVKWRYGAMQRGGGHGLIRQRQGWGLRVRQCEAGGGLGQNQNKPWWLVFGRCRPKTAVRMMARVVVTPAAVILDMGWGVRWYGAMGFGVAHLVTWHPSCLSFSLCPLPSAHFYPPHTSLVAAPLFVVSSVLGNG